MNRYYALNTYGLVGWPHLSNMENPNLAGADLEDLAITNLRGREKHLRTLIGSDPQSQIWLILSKVPYMIRVQSKFIDSLRSQQLLQT